MRQPMFRVWRRRHDGKTYVYIGEDSKRHNIRWLAKQKKLAQMAAGDGDYG